MNSETYATDYTLEEQARDRWQSTPPVVHLAYVGEHALPKVRDVSVNREPGFYPEPAFDVRYVRSDLFDAKAAELETALKHAHGLHTDLAKLDEQRAPQFAYLIVKRGAHGGVPVGFQLDEDAAWTMAELYSADEGGREYDVRKLPLATAALAVRS